MLIAAGEQSVLAPSSFALIWIKDYVLSSSRFLRATTVGILLFGVDLIFFNFFMPLVFDADIPDLIMRTGFDIISVTIGCLLLQQAELSS